MWLWLCVLHLEEAGVRFFFLSACTPTPPPPPHTHTHIHRYRQQDISWHLSFSLFFSFIVVTCRLMTIANHHFFFFLWVFFFIFFLCVGRPCFCHATLSAVKGSNEKPGMLFTPFNAKVPKSDAFVRRPIAFLRFSAHTTRRRRSPHLRRRGGGGKVDLVNRHSRLLCQSQIAVYFWFSSALLYVGI